jgi:Family of unknown function (DUF6177)
MKELSLSAVRHPFVDFGGTIGAEESPALSRSKRALSPSTSSGRRVSKGTGFDSPEPVEGPHSAAIVYAATESRSPVIFLNAGRVSLLAQAREEGRRVVLVTDELSCLTPAFAEVWREAGAAWVVRSPNGLREGFSGRRLVHVGEVFTSPPIRSVDDVDLDFLRPVPATAVQIMAVISLRHKARATTILGGPMAGLAKIACGAAPRVWGAHEPAGNRWNRGDLTSFAQSQMPGPVLMVGVGQGLRSTLTVQRTSAGLEEITEAHLSLGVASTVAFEDHRSRLMSYLSQLAENSMPLVGLIMARPGRDDLLIPPFLQHPPTPMALLIGPPGVRALDISVEVMRRQFGAVSVGRPRIPGLLFSLGSLGEPTWPRLDAILTAIGGDQVNEILGLSPRHTSHESDHAD